MIAVKKYLFTCIGVFLCWPLVAQTKSINLIDALNLALENNDQISNLIREEEIQMQRHKILRTQLFPNVSANGGYNEFIQDTRVAFIDNFIPASEINDAKTTGLNGNVNANLGLTSLIKTFAQLKASRGNMEASKADNLAETSRLLLLVAQTYFDAHSSQSMAAWTLAKMEDSKRIAELAKLKLDLGAIDSLEYYQAQINFQTDLVAYRDAEVLKKEYFNSLGVWLGQDESFELESPSFTFPAKDIEARAPEILALENRIKANKSSQTVNRLNLLPELNFFSGYGLSNQSFENGIVAQNRAVGFSYGLSLSLSIGDVKNSFHQAKINRLERSSMELTLQRLQRERKNQLELENLKRENAKLTLSARNINVKLSELALQQGVNKYELGAIDIIELRVLQNQRLNNQIEALKAQNTAFNFDLQVLSRNGQLVFFLSKN